MYFLFISLLGCLLVTTLLKHDKPGVLEISVAAFLLYTLPLSLGFVVNPSTKEIEYFGSAEYSIMSVPAFFLLCFSGFVTISSNFQQPKKKPLKIDGSHKLALYLLVAGLWLVLIRDLLDVRHIDRHLSKTEINQLTVGFGSLLIINLCSTVSAALAVFSRSYYLLLVILLGVLVQAVVFQSRSAFAFSFIAIGLAVMFRAGNIGLFKKLLLALVSLMLVMVLVIYKSIKGKLLSGTTENIDAFDSVEFWSKVLKSFEPQKTTYLLKGVVDENVILPVQYFWGSVLEAIPLSESMFKLSNPRWGRAVLDQLYSGEKGYWGNNIFAEMVTYFGIAGLALFCFFWVLVMLLLQKLLSNPSAWSKVFAISMIPLWCFFIHRLSLAAILSTSVNSLGLLLVVYLFCRCITMLTKPIRYSG
jgi:hypothetical protein